MFPVPAVSPNLIYGPATPEEERRLRWLARFNPPAVFHLTHYKAGSQWIFEILRLLTADRIVWPEVGSAQFLERPVVRSGVYPTLYITREQFRSVRLPWKRRRFVVIRDLRDTLISGYFSLKHSHASLHDEMARVRYKLGILPFEVGMIWTAETWLLPCVDFQRSWAAAREPLIKYEDLLTNDVEILERVLIEHCRLRITREQLRVAVEANRFEARTHGRKPGTEDLASHERKGIAGDWKNHFTDKIAKRFKELYGDLLIATGYEKDDRW